MKGALQHLNQQQQQQQQQQQHHSQHAATAATGAADLPSDLAQADSIQAQGIMAQEVSSAAACILRGHCCSHSHRFITLKTQLSVCVPDQHVVLLLGWLFL
jgi:hypothetical protein